jgi:hypothetical protein
MLRGGCRRIATTESAALAVANPSRHIINLVTDPKERNPNDLPYLHSWVTAPTGQLIAAFEASTRREPLIPAGAPLDFGPTA